MSIKIYGKGGCHFCDEAKKLCNDNGLQYSWVDVTIGDFKNELLHLVPSAKTVPQIFVHGKHVGGFTEFEEYSKKNITGVGVIK